MNILFVTYPHVGLNEGGLHIQIRETASALTSLGVNVNFYNPWHYYDPRNLDTCHVFSLDPSGLAYARHYARNGVQVIVSPVFNITSQTDKFFGAKVKLSSFVPGFYKNISASAYLLSLADKIICLTEQEQHSLIEFFDVNPCSTTIIPNGVSENFLKASPDFFRERYKKEKFILQVGSIEPNKNQLASIQACKESGRDLVLIGRPHPEHMAYYERCRTEGGDRVTFLGYVGHDDELLYSAYAAASLMLLPSFREVMPLVLLEANAAGLPVLVSETVPVHPSCQAGLAGRFPPNNWRALAYAISACTMERYGCNQSLIWQTVAKRILACYAQ
ncbi:MAG: glycosyltransferase family 4 protein [Sphingobium sp.]|nr:MAG: glycosyltransferase family 4 protein [Sphingobium sp.]